MKDSYSIGIDVGGTNLKIALFDAALRIKEKRILSTRSFHKKNLLITAIVDSVKDLRLDYALRSDEIAGVGLGLPGLIDFDRGIVRFFPNIPGWKQVALRSILKKALGMAVAVDNDANLMTLAEQRQGAARGFENVIGITLGTGVGGGIIIAGRLYRGGSFAAGEIGHVPVNEHGPRCNCSGEACLEAYIGNTKILAQARKVFGQSITLEQLSILAKQGNKRAQGIWRRVGFQLGLTLSGLVNVLNPDCIVIGGGVAEAGSALFDSIKETISSRALAISSSHVKIRKASLGSDAGLIGAALLINDRFSS